MTDTLLTIPTLETARLRLRAPVLSDFEAYAAFRASPRTEIIGGPYDRMTAWSQLGEIVGHWQLRGYGRWMIADRDSDAPLGITGIFHPEGWPEPELAWSVFDHAEGRGIAGEAALAARDWAYRTLGWTRLISAIGPANTRSRALAERLGCTLENTWEHPRYGAMENWLHPAPEARDRQEESAA